MSDGAAIVFDFSDEISTSNAYSLLYELGYDPMIHSKTRLHIHVVDEDLTSALEIAQANGGTLVEQAQLTPDQLTSTAYSLDSIAIPAHIINEDLIAEEQREEILPDIGGLSSFSAND